MKVLEMPGESLCTTRGTGPNHCISSASRRDSGSLLLSPSISFQEAAEDSSLLQCKEGLSEEMGELEVIHSPQKQPELPSSPAPTTEFQFYSDVRGLVLILLGRSH